jgi:membrane-associated HD superfamily phosphohydrolase
LLKKNKRCHRSSAGNSWPHGFFLLFAGHILRFVVSTCIIVVLSIIMLPVFSLPLLAANVLMLPVFILPFFSCRQYSHFLCQCSHVANVLLLIMFIFANIQILVMFSCCQSMLSFASVVFHVLLWQMFILSMFSCCQCSHYDHSSIVSELTCQWPLFTSTCCLIISFTQYASMNRHIT